MEFYRESFLPRSIYITVSRIGKSLMKKKRQEHGTVLKFGLVDNRPIELAKIDRFHVYLSTSTELPD